MITKSISTLRSEQLHKTGQILKYEVNLIPSGTDQERILAYLQFKNEIMQYLKANQSDWENWNWQMANRIQDVDQLADLLNFTPEQLCDIKNAAQQYRFAISPYYLSLIDKNSPMKQIGAMSIPTTLELTELGSCDPSAEENTNPIGKIVRRYPNRVIINITNCCASYCRHCQRKRNISSYDHMISQIDLEASIQYIKDNSEINDVLITGGDAFTLSDEKLEYVLLTLRQISHVDIIRIGSRMLVNLPQRITEHLVTTLKKYAPIYLNTQFNHPLEITPDSTHACQQLADAGIILGNQMVLLKGINDDSHTVYKLNQQLLKLRVRPYYIFHAKNVKGTMHFQTSIEKGIEIISYLQGNASGLAIPRYIISAPNGLGKIPISPDTLLREHDGIFELSTWEGISIPMSNIQN